VKRPSGSPLIAAGTTDPLAGPRRKAVFATSNRNAALTCKPAVVTAIGPLRVLVAFFSAFVVAWPASGQEARSLSVVTPGEAGYSVRHWTVEDGLPTRIVTSLAQTPDGYLWCGSTRGLIRYDGAQFRVYSPEDDPALKGLQVLELRCDSAGRLWIGGIDGELAVYEAGRFRRIQPAEGIPAGQAGKLGEVSGADFWVKGRTDDHFYRYREGRFEAVTYPGLPASVIDRFLPDGAGVRWGVDERERVMVRFTAHGPERQPLSAPDGRSSVWAGRLFRLRDGRFAVSSSHGIYALKDSQWVLEHKFESLLTPPVLDAVQDWRGNFWISVFDQGLFVSEPHGRTRKVALPDLDSHPFIRSLLLDAEGDVWLAGNDGLYRLRRNAFRPEPQTLAESRAELANTILEDTAGSLFILLRSGWVRPKGNGWDFTALGQGDVELYTGAPSRDGSVILGYRKGYEGCFLEKVYLSGRTVTLGSLAGNPQVILESRAGVIWTGTEEGLWRWDEGRFVRLKLPGAAENSPVRALIEDREGRILVGVYGGGLYRQEGQEGWPRLTRAEDTGSEGIWAICLDDDNTLWAATDAGLARWRNGEWHVYAALHAKLLKAARSVICDDHGGLWTGSEFGVGRVDRQALNAVAAGEDVRVACDWFDRSDGLPSASCVDQQGALFKSGDGRIWVGTVKGAAVVDPVEWQSRRERLDPPPVHIEAVLVDDRPLVAPAILGEAAPAARVVVPPGSQRVEFRYTAINLAANAKERFRHRLEGLDKDWVEAGNQREVVYHHLPPGDYRFQVTAANKYGLWNEAGASVALTVQPHWWQTLWFRIGAAVFLLGLLWLTRFVKLRQLHRERSLHEEFSRRLIESQEAERKRIAAELHDSLGQNLLIAKNQLFLVQEMSGNGDGRIQPKLKQVADSVDAALDEARTISHQLRPFQLERLGLTQAIRSMVKQTADSTRIPIRSQIELVDALLPDPSEVMLYRILQEALSNMIKHADAAEVQITVGRQGRHIRMVVQDDGRGFDAEELLHPDNSSRGLGLTGFQERTKLLGGHFHCDSAPGCGTTLTFEIPIPETTPGEAKD
jgi:signal transduction histidine kinase/ligand-binding sensor domain-containing protein